MLNRLETVCMISLNFMRSQSSRKIWSILEKHRRLLLEEGDLYEENAVVYIALCAIIGKIPRCSTQLPIQFKSLGSWQKSNKTRHPIKTGNLYALKKYSNKQR